MTGFIGQRLVARLKTQGAKINVLSRSQHPKYKTVVYYLQSEVVPDESLEGVDTVFHLAGLAHDLRDASEVEGLYRKINVDATNRLAVLSVRAGVKRFVFVSSVSRVVAYIIKMKSMEPPRGFMEIPNVRRSCSC